MSAIDAVVARAAEFGVRRAVKLPVSAPFHSSLIAPAAAVMREALSEVKISAPKIPVIANVTAREVSTADEIRALLVEQITGTVRWRESIDYLANKSVEEAAELGSGKVLSGLIKRIAPAIKTNSLSTPEEIDAWLASKL
jgi:[acyl-carrier-protein] S-malonyltransferase